MTRIVEDKIKFMGVEVSYTELCLILRAIIKETEKVKGLLKKRL